MTDETSQQVVVLAFRAMRFTATEAYKAVREFLNSTNKKMQNSRAQRLKQRSSGRQTVGSLIAQGQGATTIEVDKNGIQSFDRILKKYRVDYAIQKDSSVHPPKYVMFFKAKDTDVIAQAFKEYVQLEERKQKRGRGDHTRDERPSLREKLAELERKKAEAEKNREGRGRDSETPDFPGNGKRIKKRHKTKDFGPR